MYRLMVRWSGLGLLLALCLAFSSVAALAQDETAAAGNGGTGDAWANGGAAALGDVNSGGNLGNALGLGDTGGGEISGGSVANSTAGDIGVDGGTGISDASGGDDNIAFTLDPVPPAPAPVPPAPVPPAPVPPGPEPLPAFQVCVTILGGPVVCGVGACTAPSGLSACTLVDCTGLPVGISPCTFFECNVTGNVGNCTLLG